MNSITKNEVLLVLFVAIAGFVFSTKQFLMYLGGLTPVGVFAIYYVIIFLTTFLLSKLGFAIFNIKIENLQQVIGIVLIVFSIFVVINWENPYVQYSTMGSLEGASPVFYGSEDGITFYFWHDILNFQDLDLVRILTFVITPLILTFLGVYLVTNPRIDLL